jgi:hypothetical protein
MHSNPRRRYASATEFSAALERQRMGRGRFVPTVAAGMAILLVAATAFWLLYGDSNPRSLTSNAKASPQVKPRTAGAADLKVARLAIRRFPKRDENTYAAEGLGVLGEQTFRARLEDHVQIEAELSEPAYGFLIAFQPDGLVDVCDPIDDMTAPILTQSLGYPGPSNPKKIYGFTEGTGLQAFAVVVSHEPLPSFSEWKRRHGPPPWRARLQGKGVNVRGSGAAVGELRKWLASVPGVDAVAVEAFSVEPAAER